jgi:transposase
MMTPLEQRLTEEVAAQRETIKAQQVEIKLLKEKIDLLVRRVFGAKSEQLDERQLTLLLQGDEPPKKAPASGSDATGLEAEIAKAGEVPGRRKPRPRGEPRVPERLPVVEEVIEPEEVVADPQAWRLMGQEVTEQLDYEPAKFLRRRLIRRKYVRRDHPYKAPVIAPLNVLQERSIAAPGLLAAIIVAKYCDHLPLYRQEQIYRSRHRIDIPRQSMARWLGLAAEWLTPLYEHIRTGVMAGGYVQVDETPVKYLSPGNGQTKQGYLWTCKRPGGEVCFTWATSRATACLGQVLPASFAGIVQCDGYAAYPAHARNRKELTLAACWAHVRRKFIEARDSAPMQAGWVLLQLAHLYRIEARLRNARAGPRLCQARRSAESRPIIARLRAVLEKLRQQRRHLPRSAMGKALSYALSLWPMLEVYLEDGRVRIDNNEVENAIRPTAIGKKNWLFIGEAEAGQRSAILYTIIEACRSRGIDPWAYLRDVLTCLPSMTNRQLKDVLPEAWAKDRQTAQRLAA